jgi:hypothetical protein
MNWGLDWFVVIDDAEPQVAGNMLGAPEESFENVMWMKGELTV